MKSHKNYEKAIHLNPPKPGHKNVQRTLINHHKTSYYKPENAQIKNCKHNGNKRSPMRLKIVRSRD